MVGAVVLAAASGSISPAGSDSRPAEYRSFSTLGGAERGIVSPIAGDAVTLEEARMRVPYPIPTLSEASLPQVCDEGSGPVRLLQTWSNYRGTSPTEHQTALTYGHGVYLQVEPITAFRFGNVPELPSVEEAFDVFDYPVGLTTSTVRGHRAWVNELDGAVTCPSDSEPGPIQYTPGEGCPNGMCTTAPPPQAPGAFMFAPTETAVVKWLERGVVVDIVGPYPSETLKRLAEVIRWPDQ
jgi:hypothetical protein